MADLQTCLKCRALLDPSVTVCPYCGTRQHYVKAVSPRSDAVKTMVLSRWLLASYVLVYFAMLALDPDRSAGPMAWFHAPSDAASTIFGLMDGYLVATGHQFWRFLTAAFVHLSLVHLAFNSIALLYLAPLAAVTLGFHRTVVVYFVGALAGSYASYLGNPHGASAGASTALMALVGALCVYGWKRGGPGGRDLSMRMLTIAGLTLLLGVGVGTLHIDNWGHMGGFAAGAALGWPAAVLRVRGWRADRIWQIGSYFFFGLLVVVFAGFLLPNVLRLSDRREMEIYRSSSQRWLDSIEPVALGAAAPATLPPRAQIDAGPKGAATLHETILDALETARKAPGTKAALDAYVRARRAWADWAESLHILYALPRPS